VVSLRDGRHEAFHDLERDSVVQRVAEWIDRASSGRDE
jgi:alpha-beta hydrolase superfamily lysophospholipase